MLERHGYRLEVDAEMPNVVNVLPSPLTKQSLRVRHGPFVLFW
jgi:uncharacterized protein YhdP